MFRSALVALVAVLALSALAATVAQAAEGPFYKVAGARLGAGETKELKAKVKKEYVIHYNTSFEIIRCTAQKLEAGAKIIGSIGANPGTSEETISFEGCSQMGNGSPCEVENNKITTNLLTTKLVYATKERTGKILILFKPVEGTVFATFKFTGSGCNFTTMAVEESVAAEVWSGGKAVEVGIEPADVVANEVSFPEPSIKKVWVETAGKLEEKKPVLKGFGGALEEVGRSAFTLAGEPKWGVYTK
jgi:hypothetical protein